MHDGFIVSRRIYDCCHQARDGILSEKLNNSKRDDDNGREGAKWNAGFDFSISKTIVIQVGSSAN